MSEEEFTMERLEAALAEMEALEENLAALAEQERLTSMVLEDFTSSEETLKEMVEDDSDRETLLPLGRIIMVKTRILPKENVLVEIGNGIFVEKTPSEGLEILEQKREDLEKGLDTLRNRLRGMDSRRREVAAYAQKAYSVLQNAEREKGDQ